MPKVTAKMLALKCLAWLKSRWFSNVLFINLFAGKINYPGKILRGILCKWKNLKEGRINFENLVKYKFFTKFDYILYRYAWKLKNFLLCHNLNGILIQFYLSTLTNRFRSCKLMLNNWFLKFNCFFLCA